MSEPDPALPRLSRRSFWGIFALAVGIFLFGHGPVWRHVWFTIDAVNDAILWSYLPIPVLVVVALLVERRMSAKALFLDLLDITLLKYAVTFGFALVLWSIHDPPPVEATAPRAKATAVRVAAVAPTALDPKALGVVRGKVVDARGEPVASALVFVSRGLEGVVFAPPAAAVHLANDGVAISPAIGGVMVGQPISARSADGHMHTLIGTSASGTAFNVPLLPAGNEHPLAVGEAHGLMDLRCSVHPNERHAALGVFTHPFFVTTDAAGAFRFEGVPAGHLGLGVSRAGELDGEQDVDVKAGAEAVVVLHAREVTARRL